VWDYLVTWSSTAGTVGEAATLTGPNGQSSTTGTLGSTPGVPDQYFTATANGLEAAFHATATGHWIDWLDPWVLWPGCPDPEATDPSALDVEVTVHGAGFESGAVVVWDVGAPDEEAFVPDAVTENTIVVRITANHFVAGGEYLVTVENPGPVACATETFFVHDVISDTGRTQCAIPSGPTWAWVDCATVLPGDPAFGQDGHFNRPVHGETIPEGDLEVRIIDGDRVVRDLQSGLMWQGCSAGQSGESCSSGASTTANWSAELAYCQSLSWAGYDDWKLPDINELPSLFPLNGVAFPHTSGDWYWTSSPGSYATYALAWDFSSGGLSDNINSLGRFARCVRGGIGP